MGYRVSAFTKIFLFVGFVLAVGVSAAVPDTAKQPVLVFLWARVTDHVNLDVSEDRLRRILPAVEKYRSEYPAAHVAATVLFSGAASDALAERNSSTHIVDFVKDYIKRGVIEPGYDGEDEPTYKTRPALDFSKVKTLDDRWMLRAQAEERILTEGRDPLTGAPQSGKDGGLKRMQEVFGEAEYIAGVEPMLDTRARLPNGDVMPSPKGPISHGANVGPPTTDFLPEIGGDSESVREIQKYNKTTVMAGLPEDNAANLPGFGGDQQSILSLVSPAAETSPEVYWQDNVLRISEVSNASEAAAEAEHEFKGVLADELKDDLGELNRSRIQVVRVELGDERYYLKPAFTKDEKYPLKYAYDHPDHPKLPADQLKSADEVGTAYGKEANAIEWLARAFFPGNPGSRFVLSSEIKQVAAPSTGYRVSMEGLRRAVNQELDQWGNNTYPPPYFLVDDHYLSLADWFQVMTDALAELDRTGKLPESVEVVAVYGPMYTPTGHGPNTGELTAGAVAHTAAKIASSLHDTGNGTVPKNCIPAAVSISIQEPADAKAGSNPDNIIKLTSAQFLRLMAKALVAPARDTKLQVKMTYMFPNQAMLMPKTRTMGELGAMWTLKPAQLQIGSMSQAAKVQK